MGRRRGGGRGTRDGLAFFALLIVLGVGLSLGIAWTIGMAVPSVRATAFNIAFFIMTIALIIPIILSFREARARGTVWTVLWVIALIMIIKMLIKTIP